MALLLEGDISTDYLNNILQINVKVSILVSIGRG